MKETDVDAALTPISRVMTTETGVDVSRGFHADVERE
jgi:hypothetical protein